MTKNKAKEYSLEIAELLSEKKANNVLVLDIELQSSITDYLVITTAESFLHQRALSDLIGEKLFKWKIRPVHPIHPSIEDPWLLIDCLFMVIHIFLEEAREYYSLEKLWMHENQVYPESEGWVPVSRSL